MGLGKTIQTISFLSYLADVKNIWGPFLVVAPSSTLHQWRNEINKFCPELKVLPYWGSARDRKTVRKFWDPKRLFTRHGLFHVLVTSYHVFVADVKYFNKLQWQFMILDEAQAIKNAANLARQKGPQNPNPGGRNPNLNTQNPGGTGPGADLSNRQKKKLENEARAALNKQRALNEANAKAADAILAREPMVHARNTSKGSDAGEKK